jgi:hypothetical protein
MAKKDIYKIDNYFITIGFILLFIGGIGLILDPGLHHDVTIEKREGNSVSSTYEDFNGRTLEQIRNEKGDGFQVIERSFPVIRTILLANGIILLIIGYYYRSRENKIISIWNALEHTGEAHVPSLSISVGVPREFILNHLKDINAQQQAAFTYDSRSDKIINNKLLTEFLVSSACVNCGNKINEKVSLNLSNPPRCQYCGTAVPVDHLNKMKQEVLASMQIQQSAEEKGKEFSIPIFVVLLIFFWPGAIFYLVKKKM